MTAPRTTTTLIRGYLLEGRGFGHGEDYRPFLQVMRWNASPVSVQTVGSVPPFQRRMHFMCRSEWLIAVLLSWAGCHVREQLPMWPWRSPSPLYGYHKDLDPRLPWSSGTIDLCRAAAIEHGVFPGTHIPYVWTVDLVATLAWLPPEETNAVVVSIKPLRGETYAGVIDPTARGPEKLEIERRFAAELGLPYFVADRSMFPGPLLGQLEFLKSAAILPLTAPAAIACKVLLERRGADLAEVPPLEWRDRLIVDHCLSASDADLAVHHILWNQFVDADLSQLIQMDRPVRPGGWKLKDEFQRHLVGALS